MSTCYILYSQSLDSYYIGSTHDEINNRVEKHLSEFYGSNKYTAKAHDWEVYLSIPCSSFTQAIQVEKHIKKMKSRVYIRNLKQYLEMIQKLMIKYPANS